MEGKKKRARKNISHDHYQFVPVFRFGAINIRVFPLRVNTLTDKPAAVPAVPRAADRHAHDTDITKHSELK